MEAILGEQLGPWRGPAVQAAAKVDRAEAVAASRLHHTPTPGASQQTWLYCPLSRASAGAPMKSTSSTTQNICGLSNVGPRRVRRTVR
jgi:hypothetical protein